VFIAKVKPKSKITSFNNSIKKNKILNKTKKYTNKNEIKQTKKNKTKIK